MNELITIIFNLFMMPFEKISLNKRRKELITKANGKVLEIGSGGGINFNYYNPKNIESLNVLDLKFNKFILNHKLNKEININYITANAEKLPFEDKYFDTVVVTLTFCAIDNPNKALEEIYRVLKDDGKLIFIEHVLPHDKAYKNLANSLNSTWKKVGKCNINCDTYRNIENANFKISNYEKFGNKVFVFIKGIAYKI
ncbi:class I SAM-dependent methyltransferase [Romboutsia sp. 13368]|uniref:class I SAM-dependent methyltransferase n=1 Tax=Romboutsia sp. 13368 TaxID=2708053 RepID=UPI0025FDEC0B|nr:class I SAM-dependent methyltransferase [Romboutsia sp. 13368]